MIEVGDLIALGKHKGRVFKIKDNQANISWIGASPKVGDWIDLNKLTVIEAITPKPEPEQLPEPELPIALPAIDQIDNAYFQLVFGLHDLFKLIHDNRRQEAKYVRMRHGVMNMLQSGLIAGIEKKDLPPPLLPPPDELYATGEERLVVRKGVIDQIELLAGRVLAEIQKHDHPSTEIIREALLSVIAPPEERAISSGSSAPAQTVKAMTDERIAQILVDIHGRYPTLQDAERHGYKSPESMMASLSQFKDRWEKLGWMLGPEQRGGPGRRRQVYYIVMPTDSQN